MSEKQSTSDRMESARDMLNAADADRKQQKRVLEAKQNKLAKIEMQLDAKNSATLDECRKITQ